MTVYLFVVRNQCKKIFPSDYEEGFKAFYSALGNNEDGATTDIIPGAYEEYGLCATNPIPVKGTLAIDVYLRSLGLLSDESFTWERMGSTGSENIDKPIDIYSITTESGEHLCDLYISLYQNTISKKTPEGFYIR